MDNAHTLIKFHLLNASLLHNNSSHFVDNGLVPWAFVRLAHILSQVKHLSKHKTMEDTLVASHCKHMATAWSLANQNPVICSKIPRNPIG
ncbi:unnamed protein product [Sphenostylis stenocarpa]|uniref:Uncharacterized protein n=1 Tax=Sphenostylis stenocarpa TaxID=92480 RepID=A0AA86SU07_9FABA|nr:unnamed protein product [Sphenostylis stenocarpa]